MKEYFDHLKITLPLIAFCLPLFFKYSVKAKNSCPYEIYMHIDEKCLDISRTGLNNLTQELNNISAEGISKEVEELGEELGEELTEICTEEQPVDSAQIEIMEEMCKY